MSSSTPTAPEYSLPLSPPMAAVRHITDFVKWSFSKLPRGGYHWDADTESSPEQSGSEVHISADTPIDVEKVGARPAITVTRGQAVFQGVGLGDLAYHDLATGTKVQMDLMPTTILVNCLSRIDIEADGLAWFVAEQIRGFRDAIIKLENKILYIGAHVGISAPSPAGSLVAAGPDQGWCVVVVSFPAFLQHATTTMPLNKRILNGFSMRMTTRIDEKTKPVSLLQGTAVMQPILSESEKKRAVAPPGALPQTGRGEASSTEPLTVEIKT